MKHIKSINVPASSMDVVEKVTCDLCADEIESKQFITDEAVVSHRKGTSAPEGGDIEETSVDICSKCFQEKLVPWLVSQGATPRTTEESW